jgi:hypothetical protein
MLCRYRLNIYLRHTAAEERRQYYSHSDANRQHVGDGLKGKRTKNTPDWRGGRHVRKDPSGQIHGTPLMT